MSLVILRHGQDRNHGDTSCFSLLTACALIKRSKVRVHISGITTTSRNLFTRCGNLTESVRIVCNICKDYQYVHVFFEGKILCCCQCHSRSSDTLNSRVICQVYKKNSTVYRSGFLKALYKEVGLLESNTHGSKYNRKLLIFSTNLRLSCDLCRKLCMRKTGC